MRPLTVQNIVVRSKYGVRHLSRFQPEIQGEYKTLVKNPILNTKNGIRHFTFLLNIQDNRIKGLRKIAERLGGTEGVGVVIARILGFQTYFKRKKSQKLFAAHDPISDFRHEKSHESPDKMEH